MTGIRWRSCRSATELPAAYAEIIASSDAYEAKTGAQIGIESVKKNAPTATGAQKCPPNSTVITEANCPARLQTSLVVSCDCCRPCGTSPGPTLKSVVRPHSPHLTAGGMSHGRCELS